MYRVVFKSRVDMIYSEQIAFRVIIGAIMLDALREACAQLSILHREMLSFGDRPFS